MLSPVLELVALFRTELSDMVDSAWHQRTQGWRKARLRFDSVSWLHYLVNERVSGSISYHHRMLMAKGTHAPANRIIRKTFLRNALGYNGGP